MTIRTAGDFEPRKLPAVEDSSRSPLPLPEAEDLQAIQTEDQTGNEDPPPYDAPPYTDIRWNGNRTECQKILAEDPNGEDHGVAREVGNNLVDLVGSALKFSGSIPLGLSQTFHEIPRLYGDETVRDLGPVTDMRTGFQTAGECFGLGLFDGVSGLFTQPYEGACKDGVKGFFIGFGKGLGGVVCKPVEGACGLVGFGLTGVAKDCQKASRRLSGRDARDNE